MYVVLETDPLPTTLYLKIKKKDRSGEMEGRTVEFISEAVWLKFLCVMHTSGVTESLLLTSLLPPAHPRGSLQSQKLEHVTPPT